MSSRYQVIRCLCQVSTVSARAKWIRIWRELKVEGGGLPCTARGGECPLGTTHTSSWLTNRVTLWLCAMWSRCRWLQHQFSKKPPMIQQASPRTLLCSVESPKVEKISFLCSQKEFDIIFLRDFSSEYSPTEHLCPSAQDWVFLYRVSFHHRLHLSGDKYQWEVSRTPRYPVKGHTRERQTIQTVPSTSIQWRDTPVKIKQFRHLCL